MELPDPNDELYKLVVEDAQFIAREVFGRELTGEELCTVKYKIADYIDWNESVTMCIRDRVF